MADENIDVRASLTADDKASPTIQKLLKNVEALEKRLSKSFNTPNNSKLLDPKVEKRLKAVLGRFSIESDQASKAVRELRRTNRLTESEWKKLHSSVLAAEKKFAKARSDTTRKASAEQYRKTLQMAYAFKNAWNRAYEEDLTLRKQYHRELEALENARSRRSLRKLAQTEDQKRYIMRLKHKAFQNEQRQRDRRDQSMQSIRRRSIGLSDRQWNKDYEAKRRKEAADQRNLSKIRMRHLSDEQKARDSVDRRAAQDQVRREKFLAGIRRSSLRLDQSRREREARTEDTRRRRAEAESKRSHARQLREQLRMEVQHRRQMMRSLKNIGSLPGRTMDRLDSNNFFSSPYFYALAGAGAAGYAGSRILGTELRTDDAEINARIYGGLSKSDARDLRSNWADPKSISLGSTPSDMLSSYTEALKIGVPKSGAEFFTELVSQASEGWGVSRDGASDFLGTVNTILGGFGDKFDPKKLKSVANTVTYLAAQMSTTPEKMMSFMQKGAGAASSLGMSQEAGLAFGAAATSAGVQAGSAGRMFDYLATFFNVRLPELANNRGGKDYQLANESLRLLGFGSVRGMQRARDSDPDNFMSTILERLSKIKDPNKKRQVAELITGTEWSGEFGRLIDNPQIMREAMKNAKEAKKLDPLSELWALHTQKLSFAFKKAGAAFDVILGQFGEVMSPMAHQVADQLVSWSQKNKVMLKRVFRASINGLVEGLLGRKGNFGDLLGGVFGNGVMNVDPRTFNQFFKGFAEGIKSVWDTVKAVLEGIPGIDTNSAEGIGKIIGQLLGWSVAVHAFRPALTVLGAMADAFMTLFGVIMAFKGVSSVVGGLGAAGIGGSLARIASLLAGTLTVSVLGLVGVEVLKWAWNPAAYNANAIKKMGERAGATGNPTLDAAQGAASVGVMENLFLQLDIAKKLLGGAMSGRESNAPANDLIKKMGGLTDSLDQSNLIHKAALQRAGLTAHLSSGGFSGLITPASYSPSSLSGGGAASSAMSSTGGALPNYGVSRSGSIMTTGGKGMLDAIAAAEGTAGRGDYEAVLGYGKYGTPSKPLTQMTLEEAFAFGRQIKARHGSSSAIGRYQIVGNTMRDAAGALGLDWNTTRFDAATQDRMAQWIAGRQGLGAWEGFKRNPAALSAAQASLRGTSGVTAAPGQQAGAVDVMSSMLGMSETGPGRSQLNGFMRSMGTRIDAAQTAWCAGFVNSSLAAVGMKGTGKLNANSFLNWGDKIDPSQVMKGDVLVEHRGRGAGDTGGHVGMATGNTRVGPNGEQQIEMISGNSGGRRAGGGAVRTTWESANSLAVRRATAAVPTPQSITAGVPVPASATAAGRASLGGSGGGSVSISVHPTPGQSPMEIANAVERRLAERRNSFQHDLEHS